MSFVGIKVYLLLMKGLSHVVDGLMLLLSLRIVLNVQIPYVEPVLQTVIASTHAAATTFKMVLNLIF